MRSLRARLLITIGAAVLVATVLAVVVAAVLVRGRVQDQALSNLERQADAVAAVVRGPAGQTRGGRAGGRLRRRAAGARGGPGGGARAGRLAVASPPPSATCPPATGRAGAATCS